MVEIKSIIIVATLLAQGPARESIRGGRNRVSVLVAFLCATLPDQGCGSSHRHGQRRDEEVIGIDPWRDFQFIARWAHQVGKINSYQGAAYEERKGP